MTHSTHDDDMLRSTHDPIAQMDQGPAYREAIEAALKARRPLDRGFWSNLGAEQPDFRGADLTDADLSGLDLTGALFNRAILHRTKLDGAILYEAEFSDADLLAASFVDADLTHARGVQSNFGHANLAGARLAGVHFTDCTFTKADLSGVDATGSRFACCRLREANLASADLTRTSLQQSDFRGANVERACFRNAQMRAAHVGELKNYMSADWIGVDLRDADFRSGWLLRRHVIDENFLWEFRHQSTLSKIAYYAWKITSDCGRSAPLWGVWCLGMAGVFGLIFSQLAIDYGDHPTALSPFYFSVVTMTTLGYGDALPTDAASQLAVITEVIVGYVMFAGFASIITSKMGRRGD